MLLPFSSTTAIPAHKAGSKESVCICCLCLCRLPVQIYNLKTFSFWQTFPFLDTVNLLRLSLGFLVKCLEAITATVRLTNCCVEDHFALGTFLGQLRVPLPAPDL